MLKYFKKYILSFFFAYGFLCLADKAYIFFNKARIYNEQLLLTTAAGLALINLYFSWKDEAKKVARNK
ncbi:hypothetical protein [Adhaeribacter terreus]|uniref:Uncharacterized protein n=1 Tax=Adhaeribacter terreus TaxID=529703 RepID=A0ABW0EAI2_9BACT